MALHTGVSRPSRGLLFLIALALTPLWAADVDSSALLTRVQEKVLAGAHNIPRYYCRQFLERQVFEPTEKHSQGCSPLPAAASDETSSKKTAGYSLVSSDRAYLDVMVAGGTELFSWPGGGRFSTNDPSVLLGGGFSGNGDFGTYLTTVFGAGRVTVQYMGACEAPSCVRYAFRVPVAISGYWLKTPISQVTVGYQGTFDVDPQAADLLSMTVTPTDLSQAMNDACELRTQMKYTHNQLSGSEFLIPESVGKEYLAANGFYFKNSTRYTECREYTAESALTFGDDAPGSKPQATEAAAHLPLSGAKLELRLTSKIDSNTNAAGDVLEAALVRAAPDTAGGTIPKGTLFHGHLAVVERTYSPKRSVAIAMRFDTIVLNGVALPLTLIPVGERDLRGRAVFQFPQARVVLDRSFTSGWRVQ